MKPGIAIVTYLSVTQFTTDEHEVRDELDRARTPEAPETADERPSPSRRLLRALRGATA
jgi:hypothetical protein